jgi:hypothetical protein
MTPCPHGNAVELCKECYLEILQAEKQAKKRVPIKKLKNRSREQELAIGAKYREAGFKRARKVPMSGSIDTLKGDIDPGELFLAEAKLTRTGQLVIKTEWLKKIQKEAIDKGYRDWYALHAWVADGNEHYHKVVVVDEDLWYAVLRDYKEREANDRNR